MDFKNSYNNYQLLQGASAGLYGVSAMANLLNAGINYKLLSTQNQRLGLQADNIELQAEQEINSMKEQFNQAIANYQYSAVKRGIKSISGSVQENIEMSSKNLAEDNYMMRQNAKHQAESVRDQQRINQSMLKAQKYQSRFNTGLNLMTDLVSKGASMMAGGM